MPPPPPGGSGKLPPTPAKGLLIMCVGEKIPVDGTAAATAAVEEDAATAIEALTLLPPPGNGNEAGPDGAGMLVVNALTGR